MTLQLKNSRVYKAEVTHVDSLSTHPLFLLVLQTFTPKLVLLDFSDISCVQDVAKEVLDCYGCVDILINNASVKVKGPAHKISLELDKKIMDANYFGPITLTKGLVSLMFPWISGVPWKLRRVVYISQNYWNKGK